MTDQFQEGVSLKTEVRTSLPSEAELRNVLVSVRTVEDGFEELKNHSVDAADIGEISREELKDDIDYLQKLTAKSYQIIEKLKAKYSDITNEFYGTYVKGFNNLMTRIGKEIEDYDEDLKNLSNKVPTRGGDQYDAFEREVMKYKSLPISNISLKDLGAMINKAKKDWQG